VTSAGSRQRGQGCVVVFTGPIVPDGIPPSQFTG
jgi:hypothetical protein